MVATSMLENSTWRWGCKCRFTFLALRKMTDSILPFADGMFAILVPASLSPLIITLFWAERKAKKLQLIEAPVSTLEAPVRVPILRRIWLYAEQLDIVGLAILGTAVALILLPLTLAQGAKGQWHNRECTLLTLRSCAC